MAKKKPIAQIFGTTTDVCRETKKSDVNFVVQIGEYTFPMHAMALYKAVKEVENGSIKNDDRTNSPGSQPNTG